MKKWEYIVLRDEVRSSNDNELQAKLNDLGTNGWEVVSQSTICTVGTTHVHIFILKREK